MTDNAVKKQIAEQMTALKEATSRATKSRDAANKYLISAGIISAPKPTTTIKKAK